jgi:uncharacterized protein YndB with AHSA1/START domain
MFLSHIIKCSKTSTQLHANWLGLWDTSRDITALFTIKSEIMITKKKANVKKDAAGKKIKVTKEFDADVQQVWNAWTDSNILDKWWAPKPWRAETKKMEFRQGGSWLYAMVGPNDERHWARVNYKKIDAPNQFTALDAFCDENGNTSTDMPSMQWKNSFTKTADGTRVDVEITFEKEADMDNILKMGFEEGFTMALENLDEVLSQ